MKLLKIVALIIAIGAAGSLIPSYKSDNSIPKESAAQPEKQLEPASDNEKWQQRADMAILAFAKERGIDVSELAIRAGTSELSIRSFVAVVMKKGAPANEAIESLINVAALAKNQKPLPEMVAVYLGEHGNPQAPVDLSKTTAVIYQERKCNLESIPFYQRMRYATMSGVPVCAFKSDSSVFIVGAGDSMELPEPFFAQARVQPDGATAEVIDQSYDGKRAAQEYINQQRAAIQRQTIGAQKPLRESDRHADN